MLKTLSYLATIALVSFCSLFEGALTPEEGPESESPSLNLTISIAADYRGPDFLFTIVEVTNDSESSVSAEVGIKATGGSSTKPNTGSAGIQEIPAGQTVKYEVTTAGLAKNTDYSIQAFATVDGKTYTSEAKYSGTEPLRFYLSPETTEYSYGEGSQTLDLGLISNVPFEEPVMSEDWISIKSYYDEHYKTYNYYVFQIAANEGEKDRSATITFASKKYNTTKVVTVKQSRKIPATGETAGHAWVNLALPSSTLWATMNVGAQKPEECGRYVAWGETVIMGEEDKENEYNYKHYNTYIKDNYSDYSYKFYHDEEYKEGDNIWGAGKCNVLHKYYKDDALTSLEAKDDAASVKWGEAWTMPTYEQVQELIRNTKYEWTSDYKSSGVAGAIFYRLKSDSSASYTTDDTHIFIPASGYADYKQYKDVGDWAKIWTKTMQNSNVSTNPYYYVWSLFFSSNNREARGAIRDQGLCVRPVVK